MESSEEAVGVGMFGVSVHLHSSKGVDVGSFLSMMERIMQHIAERLSEKRPMLGHIKSMVTAPEGFLMLNLLDRQTGVETTNTIEVKTLKEADLKIAAEALGVADHEIASIIGESLMPLSQQFDISFEDEDHRY